MIRPENRFDDGETAVLPRTTGFFARVVDPDMHRSVPGAIAIVVVLATVGGVIALDPFPLTPPSNQQPDPDRVTPGDPGGPTDPGAPGDSGDGTAPGLVQFESAAQFEEYVRESREASGYHLRGGFDGGRMGEDSAETVTEAPSQTPAEGDGGDGGAGGSAGDARVSDTNVQEVGIDEPDVLKTRGSTVFYVDSERYGGDGGDAVSVLDASDPAAPAPVGEIDDRGRMLAAGDGLVIFGRDEIHG